jgi:hypothetical protein
MNALSQSQQLAFAFALFGVGILIVCWLAFFVIDGLSKVERE